MGRDTLQITPRHDATGIEDYRFTGLRVPALQVVADSPFSQETEGIR